MPTFRLTDHLLRTRAFAADPVVVVDCGCAGGFDRAWERYGDQATFIGFDPNEPATTWAQGQVFNWAVAGDAGSRVFYQCKHPNSSSLLSPDPAWAKRFPWQSSMVVEQERTVRVDTVDQALIRAGLRPDFAKMDIEGMELEVLQGSPGLVGSCLGMSLEAVFFPVRQGQPTFSDVDRFMQDYGYMLAIISPHRHFRSTLSFNPFPENRGQMVWAQSLWVRDAWAEMEAERAGEWGRSRVLKMLSLLDISGLPDMAIEVAQEAGKWGILDGEEVTGLCDLLTPTVDGVQFSYAEYVRQMSEVSRPVARAGAAGTARHYRTEWGGRLG